MKRLTSHFGILLTICLITGLTAFSKAEIENLKFELFGVVNSDDERQIRRRLEPWAEPDGVTFHTPIDKNGRARLFSTLIKVKPRTDDKFSESHTLDTYQILQQLKDQRFRGRQAGSQPWIVKSEAKIKGELFAHPGWARSYIRNVPFCTEVLPKELLQSSYLPMGSKAQAKNYNSSVSHGVLRCPAIPATLN